MKVNLSFSPSELIPYINWVYFYHAWGIKNYSHDAAAAKEAEKIKAEAIEVINRWDKNGYRTHFRCNILLANSDGEDIILGSRRFQKVSCLRQQRPPYLCLADFLPPVGMKAEKLGLFAATVPFAVDGLMEQTTADRLAEATAELGHMHVRRDESIWGFAPDENLTPQEMFQEHFQGIRPAVGYPSMPDQSIIFVLADLLDFPTMGIKLTCSGAMLPHATTAGLIISHPKAHHFAVGPIGNDQLQSYANRRGMTVESLKDFIDAAASANH